MTNKTLPLIMVVLLSAFAVFSQTTEFTYQGSLTVSGSPANGNYDFEFALFDSLSAGTQLGSTLTRSTVAVANGAFALKLDFGANFPGANRFLEIRVRPSGIGSFTALAPRQQVNSSPYSVRSLNAANADNASNAMNATNATNATTAATATNALSLGGVAANQYVLTGDARLSDARTPTAGSGFYIQNQNAAAQPSSNFNISGNGTAAGTLAGGIVSAATQFNLGTNRILTADQNNLFIGTSSGYANTTGAWNSFVGLAAGIGNTSGNYNSFFGNGSGYENTIGGSNSFFGADSGSKNVSGNGNSFFGTFAGNVNSTGGDNSFFGVAVAAANTTGYSNTFVGRHGGWSNVSGSYNSLFGAGANVGSGNLYNASAIGGNAMVTQSNSLILGGIQGINGGSDTNVGIGTTAPSQRLHVVGNGLFTGNLTVNGTLNALVSGDGSAIANLNASNITTGTLNNTRLGVIGIANGGTGSTDAPSFGGLFFRSIGPGAWGISPLLPTDIPELGGIYVRNGTVEQIAANFNIGGNGTAAGTLSGRIVNAALEFDQDGHRILSGVGDSLFVGSNTGLSSAIGGANSFFGQESGVSNTTGDNNAFFGFGAGRYNTGRANSFFGSRAGYIDTTGLENSFFGIDAGRSNTTANWNSFFGAFAGRANTSGDYNSFFGKGGGDQTTTGSDNTFFGAMTGRENTSGQGNTVIGSHAGLASNSQLNNATAIGFRASAGQSNSLILGSINGVNGATEDTNVGIGTTTPSQRLHVIGNGLFTGNLDVGGTISGTFNGTVSTANNALNLGGVAANQYVQTGDARLSDARTPTAGSGFYIQNQNAAPQSSANFNITGTGTASNLNATTQFSLKNYPFMSFNESSSVFLGVNAGIAITTGQQNAFVGFATGGQNTTGNYNSFLGPFAGQLNTTGSGNTFVGDGAGYTNASGNNNTTLGFQANLQANNLVNATAIGYRALVGQNNSLVLGGINGVNGATSDINVGIGTTSPAFKLHVVDASNQGLRMQNNTAGGTVASFGANGAFEIDGSGLAGGRLKVLENGNVGIGMPAGSNVNNKLDVVGTLGVWTLNSGGSVPLCWHTGGYNLSTCGSSLRYKTNIGSFRYGMNIINRLRPITFDWKEGGVHDFGLAAEDVAQIDPLLVTYNQKGEVEGVKYDRIGVVLINAVKEQQAELELQRKVIEELKLSGSALQVTVADQGKLLDAQRKALADQHAEISSLKTFICRQDPPAAFCSK